MRTPPKCIHCGSNEHQEMWGESGEFWWHCHQCDKDSDENIDTTQWGKEDNE